MIMTYLLMQFMLLLPLYFFKTEKSLVQIARTCSKSTIEPLEKGVN